MRGTVARRLIARALRRRAITTEQKAAVLERLGTLWEENPDLRLGQLISNCYRDPFYVEDFDLIAALEHYYRGSSLLGDHSDRIDQVFQGIKTTTSGAEARALTEELLKLVRTDKKEKQQ